MSSYQVVKEFLLEVLTEHGTVGVQAILDSIFKDHPDIRIQVIDYEA